MTVEIKIPEVGESITEAQILQWLKQEGDEVDEGEAVAELETDKVTLDLPAPEAGVLSKLLKDEGETAEVGEVVAYLETNGGEEETDTEESEKEAGEAEDEAEEDTAEAGKDTDQDSEEKKSDKQAKKTKKAKSGQKKSAKSKRGKEGSEQEESSEEKGEKEKVSGKTEKTEQKGQEKAGAKRGKGGKEESEGDESLPSPEEVEVRPRVMPAAQRALAEHGLEAEDVKATGPGGRVLKEDVLRHVRGGASQGQGKTKEASRDEKVSGDGREERVVAMSSIRRRIASRLVEAQQQAALLTTFNEADMTMVKRLRAKHGEAFKEEHGVKLGITSFFIKAVVAALEKYPALNAEIRGEEIAYRSYCDIGVAMNSERGLLVPVIENAHRKGIPEIEQQIDDFASRAKSGKIKLEELQGGTFTITNGGVFGSLLSTPIVDPPQSGVLGMHAIQDRPVARDGEMVIRPMMYLALTYDHRIVDGREAVSFLRTVKELVEDPGRLLLDV